MANKFFDLGQRECVGLAGEANGIARGAGTRGAADAMNIVLSILWQVVIDDVTDIRHMEPA